MGTTTRRVSVRGSDQVAEARRTAKQAALEAGFSEHDAGRVALVATEAATNLIKHAGEGEILVNSILGAAPEVEVLALDKGPGISDVERSFQDGYSTAGSPGTGLGAIRRIAAECDVYTGDNRGLALLARVRPERSPAPRGVRIGAVSTPYPGEIVCGDGWASHQTNGSIVLLVVDGLGHGQPAAESAVAMLSAFAKEPDQEPADLIRALHAAARPTRGGAASAARIDRHSRRICFAGIGNVAGMVTGPTARKQMVAHAGIVGHDIGRVREFTYEWAPGDLVLLYSDGLSTHLAVESYGGITTRDPTLIAGLLYRDWSRGRDDATVLVCRVDG